MKTFLICVATLVLALPCLAAETIPGLQPIYLLTNGLAFRLSTIPDETNKVPAVVAFKAVCTNEWLPGLVPVFAVKREERFELRRRPMRGQEKFSEPLFFALPATDEPETTRIAGRWDVIATRDEGSKEYLAWELSSEGHFLAGRFDQHTDYRFAHLTGGSFRSNQFELRGEYISDAFVLTGTWETNQLKGEWHRTDGSERGTWQANRPYAEFKPSGEAVPLYEWRSSEGKLRYALKGQSPGRGWQRNSKPLCHVWK